MGQELQNGHGKWLIALSLFSSMLFACSPKVYPQWHGITVGQTSPEEVVALVGEPEKIDSLRDRWIYYYPSVGYKEFPNRIWIRYDCGCVVRVLVNFSLEEPELVTFEEVLEEYGLPEAITRAFYPYPTVALIYPQMGRMFIVDESHPHVEVIEVFAEEYFLPMTLEQFGDTYDISWQYPAPVWWDQYVQP